MAETRKHKSYANDPLTRAVQEAIGDVRPFAPGAPQDPPASPASGPRRGVPSATLGTFTFSAAPAEAPTPDEE